MDERSKLHRRKMIAPIVITIIMVLYYAVYFGWLIWLLDSVWALFIGIIPVAIGGTCIYVCVQRIREIKGGEEDDLSKY